VKLTTFEPQLTEMDAMTLVTTVPLPLATVHNCPAGWVRTTMLYVAPEATAVGRVNTVAEAPSDGVASVPFARTRPVVVNPVMAPPTV
jgi:hypothetical protein